MVSSSNSIERDRDWRSRAFESASREVVLSRLLFGYIAAGLGFMLLPGTFLGVWNLMSISSGHSAGSVSDAWIQAHGHAQLFGWIGTFILGIGYYSIPKMRRRNYFTISDGWLSWGLWISGVALRWFVNVYQVEWRLLLPLSAALEIAAFLIFFRAVAGHRPGKATGAGFEAWQAVVIGGTAGFLATLALNLVECVRLSLGGTGPAFPHDFDIRFLTLAAWGFVVPFVWGFSSRWMPVFLGLKKTRGRLLVTAFLVLSAAVIAALAGAFLPGAITILAAVILSVAALGMFEPSTGPAKTRGVHRSFPVFVRLAYGWLIIAALINLWGSTAENPTGILGASRHALTVGFFSVMVFTVGPRVLPAFCGLRKLFSPSLMFSSLILLTAGCAMRVSSEIIAYQGYAPWAWKLLPVSAFTELAAVTLFAVNMALTLAGNPQVPRYTSETDQTI